MAAVVGACVAILLAIAFVWVVVQLARAGRLFRTAVARLGAMPCPRCGSPVGTQAAATAQADWQERTRKAHEHARQMSLRLRIDPCWRFVCPACSASLVFEPHDTQVIVAQQRG